jgi:hypothetical protein
MSNTLNSVKINLSKLDAIDRSKLYQGQNGPILDLVFSVSDEPNQYGQNVSVFLSQTKEEREAKKAKVYLGNGTTFWKDGEVIKTEAPKVPSNKQFKPQTTVNIDDNNDLPF